MSNFISYLFCVFILAWVLILLNYVSNISTKDYHKASSYECGFEPFGSSRSFFDIHFYVIGMIFIIFDVEIVFLLPFIIDPTSLSLHGFLLFVFFIFFIGTGLGYESNVGLLRFIEANRV
jgi:NADH-quinone oxidoreductase subunit A